MEDLIIMTIILPLVLTSFYYIITGNKYFSIFFSAFCCSASIPLFFYFKYDIGFVWLMWLVLWISGIFYVGKKYPDKMKKYEKFF